MNMLGLKKKFLLFFIFSCALLTLIPGCAFATTGTEICDLINRDDPNYEIYCGAAGGKNEEAELMQTVANILNAIYGLIAIIAVVMIVIAGVKYTTSQGDPGKVAGAKNTILYAIIGLIVTLLAFAITAFVLSALGGSSTGGGSDSHSDTEVTSVRLTTNSFSFVEKGSTKVVKCTVSPDYATDKSVLWEIEDTNVAQISSVNGGSVTFTSKNPGHTTATCKSSNGKTASVSITTTEEIKPAELTLNPTSVTIVKGNTKTITATITPSNAKNKTLTWSSADATIAAVDAKGVITGKKAGSTKVTATTFNNITATVNVTVTETASNPAPTPPAGDRLKFGEALAVLHTDRKYTEQAEKAGQQKFYSIECDIISVSGSLYCYHPNTNTPSKTSYPLSSVMSVAKRYGMKVIYDMGAGNASAAAQAIKANGWKNDVIIQLSSTSMLSTMNTMNAAVGSKLEYWGLIYLGSAGSVYNYMVNNASALQAAGMTGANIQSDKASSYANGIRNKGYEVCIFAWGSLRNSYPTYAKYSPTYIMSDERSNFGL